ncbi:hypothetical protein ACO0QE_000452 [Hanseniaspora vineae]
MGFISSIFCGSSDSHQNGSSSSGHGHTSNSGSNSKLRQKASTPPATHTNTATGNNSHTNNGGKTHKASPAASNGNLKKQRSSHSKNAMSTTTTRTTTTTTRANENVNANSHSNVNNIASSSSSSSNSTRKQVKVANTHAQNNGYGNSQGTTTPTPRTSTSSSVSVTNEKLKISKSDLAQEEKNYTVVTEQVGEEEEEDDNNNEKDNKEKQPEDDVNYEMDVDSDSEQQAAPSSDLHEQQQKQQQQLNLQGGVPLDELHAASPHTISATGSVVVHETMQSSDSECSAPGTPPSAPLSQNQQNQEASSSSPLPPPQTQQQYQDEQQQMMAQMSSGEITPLMESNFIDLTKLQKGQAHAKGCETLLGPKDQKMFGNKKCLVLDLDETLVHSSFKYVRNADFVIPVEIDNQVHNVYVIKRPGVDKFLETVAKYYEVVVFTASVSRYGDPLLDILDNVKTNHGGKLNVHHRLFRDSCYTYEGNYVKNLSQIGRPLEDIIILDNSPASYIFHPQHAVPISSWFSDTHDNELIDILPILTDLSGVPDVSMVLDVSL